MKAILLLLTICAILLSGCATAHKQITAKTAALGPPHWECSGLSGTNCALVQSWEVPGRKPGTTAQLTPVGCALHTFATFGHIAWECRNEKATRGKWLWHKGMTEQKKAELSQ